MPTTPIHALPYPASSDAADVPVDMGELANAVDGKLPPVLATGWLKSSGGAMVWAAITQDDVTGLDARLDAVEATANGAVSKGVVDAAGDLILGSGPDTVARLAKGSDGQVLTVSAGAVAWAAAAGGGGGAVDYVGTWAAGTPYTPGQVVTHDGIDYLAVNPSTGQTPPTLEEAMPISVIDAAEDLVVGSGADAVKRLAKGTDGQVLTVQSGALGWATPAAGGGQGGEQMAYAEVTSNVSVTGTTPATGTPVVSAGSVTFDGATYVAVEFGATDVSRGSAAYMRLGLFLDGTMVAIMAQFEATFTLLPYYFRSHRLLPSAGAHTYSIRGWVPSSTGTIYANDGGTADDTGSFGPAWIRVVKV